MASQEGREKFGPMHCIYILLNTIRSQYAPVAQKYSIPKVKECGSPDVKC